MILVAFCEIVVGNVFLEKGFVNLFFFDSSDLFRVIWYKWNEIVG